MLCARCRKRITPHVTCSQCQKDCRDYIDWLHKTFGIPYSSMGNTIAEFCTTLKTKENDILGAIREREEEDTEWCRILQIESEI